MTERDIKKYCKIDSATVKILETAAKRYSMSARAYGKVLKTARTIADLEGSEDIQVKHVLESLQYRLIQD